VTIHQPNIRTWYVNWYPIAQYASYAVSGSLNVLIKCLLNVSRYWQWRFLLIVQINISIFRRFLNDTALKYSWTRRVTRTHARTYARIHVCIHAHMYACTHIRTLTHTHAHTHIHTHTQTHIGISNTFLFASGLYNNNNNNNILYNTLFNLNCSKALYI